MSLIYDLETATFGKISPYTNSIKLFGCLDTETGKITILKHTEREKIQEILSTDVDKVSYNGRGYDNIILRSAGYSIQGRIVDLLDIVRAKRYSLGFTKSERLSLKNVGLKLNFDVEKGDVDYDIFNNDDLIEEHWDEVCEYLKKDLLLTKQLYDYFIDVIEERDKLKQQILSNFL